MIRIKHGTFGYFDGRRVVPVTRADGPQSYDPELEARLVAEGTAEYVDGVTVTTEAELEGRAIALTDPAHEVVIAPHVTVDVTVDGEPAPELEDMTRAELAEYAETLGIRPGKMTKAKLIAAIEEAEQAPALTAAEVE